ncbi:putative DNA primase [Megalodesulfovibrio gigas DSM 1382 = ATCC 19364]|uniref:Putative DNA primase n=1 Tax=Megalodesulfovibrio gigas (strain ATCC 19364 / DSM 1382 / NCIMB 9332 / VKM B-1759) TaxID=1121448 RepID=T2GAJ9_MEGG1|nr:putative DNA primase [Megalodesulfovibrio gigas DSM 1382 = ATCC 19364]
MCGARVSVFPIDQMRRAGSTAGGEWAGPCPRCGGQDRFRAWPDHPRGKGGRFYCRGCGWTGDGIQYLRDACGASYAEACQAVGGPTAAGRGWMRSHPRPAASSLLSKLPQPTPPPTPPSLWKEAAAAFVAQVAGPSDYSRARGLEDATVQALRLGWNPRDRFVDRLAWGLPPGKRLWLPAGLVIPTMPTVEQGEVVALKIRRLAANGPKYVAIPGGSTAPMVLARAPQDSPAKPIIIVEGELDAILLAQAARDLVTVLALRSVSNKPDATTTALLHAAPAILCALDFDRAGQTAWPWWHATFHARYHPPATGKDVGDMVAAGVDVREWVGWGLEG